MIDIDFQEIILDSEVYKKIKAKSKSNPNHWTIIYKWNNRIREKYKVELFKVLLKYMDKKFPKIYEEKLKDFVDIEEFKLGDAATG